MWCIVLTMTTVGYGDIYPMTILGRVIAVIACLWGTFLTSLMVVALKISTEHSKQEQRAFNEIKRYIKNQNKEQLAKDFIVYAIKYWLMMKR